MTALNAKNGGRAAGCNHQGGRQVRDVRLVACTEHGIEVHGVLWIIDELRRHDIETPVTPAEALRPFDPRSDGPAATPRAA